MPEISIIVPVYKVEAYLPTCIDSILAQTFSDFELILVDDGSPDNCPKICDEAARKDPRVRVLHQQNAGLSAARNAGIEAAQGAWLGFVDSDDCILPDFYEKLYHAAQQAGTDCSVCSIQRIRDDGSLLEPDPEMLLADGVLTREQVWQNLRKRWDAVYVSAWNKLYKREVFRTLRYPEGRLNEDIFIQAELYGQLDRVACVSVPLYCYRIRQGSIMHSRPTLKNLDQAWAFCSCFRYFEAHGLPEMLPAAEDRVFAKLMGVYYRLPPQERRKPEMKQARKMQRELTRILWKNHSLTKRALFRTVLFQAFPGLYGLRVRGAIAQMDAEQKERYSEAR